MGLGLLRREGGEGRGGEGRGEIFPYFEELRVLTHNVRTLAHIRACTHAHMHASTHTHVFTHNLPDGSHTFLNFIRVDKPTHIRLNHYWTRKARKRRGRGGEGGRSEGRRIIGKTRRQKRKEERVHL